jgi:hypothetical protein
VVAALAVLKSAPPRSRLIALAAKAMRDGRENKQQDECGAMRKFWFLHLIYRQSALEGFCQGKQPKL